MNRKAHDAAGRRAGALVASARSKGSLWQRLWETLGGLWSGRYGGLLPDKIEPAIHPNHRKVAHSVAVTIGVAAASTQADRAAEKAREYAERCRQVRQAPEASWLDKLLSYAGEALCCFVAGAINGVGPGYVSHNLLDATTPKGLPFFGLT